MISKKTTNKAAPFDVTSYILGLVSGKRRQVEIRRASAEYEEQQQAPEVHAADQKGGNEADAGK